MVYVAQPHSAIPCTSAYFAVKENWPRSQKRVSATKQASCAAPISAVPFPTTNTLDSDIEVEAAIAAAPAKASVTDADLKSSTSVSDWCAQMVCYIWFSGIDNHDPSGFAFAASSPASRPGRLSVTNSPTTTTTTTIKRHSKKLSLGSLSEAVSFSVRDLHNAVEAHAKSAVDNTRGSRPSASERSNDPRTLRLFPRRRFTDFVRNMLNITQVSKSVIILALLYIHRLKSKNPGLRGQDGSEFRLFVTALMLANKFLDDHTYTNKTWSELSGLKLKDVTKMEIEFWLGLSSNIHASDADFKSWIGTLEILAERRQLALGAHEAEKLRQAALRQQGLVHHSSSARQPAVLQPHQAPGFAAIYDAPRRIAHNSRVSQTRSWSPEQLGLDTRPRLSPAATANSHLSHVYAPQAPAASMPRFDVDASVQAFMTSAGYPTPAADSRPLQTEVGAGSKRQYHQETSPVSEGHCYHTPSPERGCKRRNVGDGRALHAYTAAASGRNWGGLSPPFAQPCARSVFEPLVSTPNTLLAPYVMHHNQQQGMQSQHLPLAYWQLAAGYDRGILGVHMPAPINCQSNDYFHWQPSHAEGHDQVENNVVIRKPLATTTPYPTPPIDAFSPFHHHTLGHSSKQGLMHGYPHQFSVQAPHAPFNNAELHYVDPLFIRY
ncbi:uncharacterized protein MEPE_05310 [Melanopsichium pennsylvanicum]|uniref:Cyclin-like protein n=2 Tax=Melanopsichium pennsylvanicum TaxID=63383 RepID=A0AAJ4XRJ2_9BASI|nr:conserved hypothetical protein [Melanopsichium pennsylvanicum 4]SNX86601.1 uncharacterized protein MEPE_05310 [Melanopsichium pennsylvanicum]